MHFLGGDHFFTPGAGETLEFNASTTVSGVLITDAIYRLVATEECWIEIDNGAGGMSAKDTTALFMPDNHVEYFRTTEDQCVLHALGTTTSGLLNYIHLK